MTAGAAPILTLTGNLLAERTLEFSEWSAGRTQRAVRESFQVGGKGINVARMLARLGAPVTALGFAGGAPGLECEEWLARQRFSHHLFRTLASTRAGTVVRTSAGAAQPRPETTFLGPDAPPDAAALRACAAFLDARPAGEVLALCGSLPGWAGPDYDPLRAALVRWRARGRLAIDTYGPPLAWCVALAPDLIKINAQEFAGLGLAAPPPGTATRWIVTDGPQPVRIWDAAGLRTVQPPSVREVSPTGSGDVLHACVIDALFRHGRTLDEAVSLALPFAAANAAHPGIAEFPEPAALQRGVAVRARAK